MTYTPTNWKSGDTITAEKLNKLENGLADCCGGGAEPLVIRETRTESGGDIVYTLDKTWQEIYDAYPLVRFVSPAGTLYDGAIYAIKQIAIKQIFVGSRADYTIRVDNGASQTDYITDSPSGYPSYGGGGK